MITLTDILYLHEQSINDVGGSHGTRDQGMLESAIERPYATFGGEELYLTVFLKAAALLESVVKNYPFVNGNKRTGWLACIAIMCVFKFKFTLAENEAYNFVIKVAASHLELEAIALFIELHSVSL